MRILQSAAARPTWNAEELAAVLETVQASAPAADIERNLEPGEDWAHISAGCCEPFAKVRAPTSANRAVRFAFVLRGAPLAAELAAAPRSAGADVVELADFEAEELSIDVDDLACFVNGRLPPPQALNPERFAANDLVFVSE